MSSDLERVHPVSEAAHFDLVLRQADILAKSSIVPSAYRGKAADIVAAGLAGRAYGWDAMTALRNFHVIEGTASLRPEAMLGLVRVAGHSVTVDATDEQARAVGTRADTGDTHTAVFTLADAAAAGLANKRNWKQYPTAMLTWRAVSQLCRVLFPDVVLGAGYVPEELGAEVTQGGEVAEVEAVEPFEVLEVGSLAISPSDAKNELLGACGDDVDLAKGLWGDRGSEEIDRAALDVLVKEGELQHRDAVAEQVAFEERPFVDTEATHQP